MGISSDYFNQLMQQKAVDDYYTRSLAESLGMGGIGYVAQQNSLGVSQGSNEQKESINEVLLLLEDV